jgi:hypothetical protein
MNIVLDTYLFDALQAQSEGVDFPVEFEAVWEAFGFTRKDNAQKYFKKNAETFVKLNLLQLEGVDNQSIDFNKLRLSIAGFKFALARAKTDKGAEYLLHLLLIEKQFLAQLEAQFTAPAHTAPTFEYSVQQLHIELYQNSRPTRLYVRGALLGMWAEDDAQRDLLWSGYQRQPVACGHRFGELPRYQDIVARCDRAPQRQSDQQTERTASQTRVYGTVEFSVL